RHTMEGRALLWPPLGLAALVGAGVCAARARSRVADKLLVCVAGGSLAAGILSNPGGAPNTARICVAAALAPLFAAVALTRWEARLLEPRLARPSLVAALAATAVFAVETLPFFAEWPEHPRVRSSFCTPETLVGRTCRRLAPARMVLE